LLATSPRKAKIQFHRVSFSSCYTQYALGLNGTMAITGSPRLGNPGDFGSIRITNSWRVLQLYDTLISQVTK